MKIKIDKDKCIGCSLCTEICKESFEMDGDKAKVKKENIKKLSNEKEAADSCPSGAITIYP